MSLQLIITDTVQMMDCPRWDSCSANICVLNGTGGVHLEGDDICVYLVEAAKGDAGVPPKGEHTEAIMAAARHVWVNKAQLPYALRKPLDRASKSGSKRSSSTLLPKAA